jgi:Right handed beta helix region
MKQKTKTSHSFRSAAVVVLLLSFCHCCGIASAETYVFGAVSGVWDAAGSPYIVTQDIVVLEGTGLLINPGVEVQFTTSKEMWVYGQLRALGSEAEPIQFSGVEDTEWRGIQLISAQGGTSFHNCRFIGAISGGDSHQTTNGGAIYSENSSPVIAFCQFVGCESQYSMEWGDKGGAIYCDGGNPRIFNCDFTDCRQNACCHGGGGGIFFKNAANDIVISGCTFNSCYAHGGGAGICGHDSDVDISHCEFRDCGVVHYGGAVFIEDCTGRLFNSLFVGNRNGEPMGSGIAVYDCDMDIASCTIVDGINYHFEPVGGALSLTGSSFCYVFNCILWNNVNEGLVESPQIYPPDGYSDVYNCDVQFGWFGYGSDNIDADPLFAFAGDWDFCLSTIAAGQADHSPCIDTGSSSVESWELADYSTRTDQVADSGIVDMGYHRLAGIPADVVAELSQGDLFMTASPNPFNGSTTIRLQGSPSGDGNSIVSNAGHLRVYDLAGRLIRRLAPGTQPGGIEYIWDGLDGNGRGVSPGAYFMRLENGNQLPAGASRIIVLR